MKSIIGWITVLMIIDFIETILGIQYFKVIEINPIYKISPLMFFIIKIIVTLIFLYIYYKVTDTELGKIYNTKMKQTNYYIFMYIILIVFIFVTVSNIFMLCIST